jgi:hypothetical protein
MSKTHLVWAKKFKVPSLGRIYISHEQILNPLYTSLDVIDFEVFHLKPGFYKTRHRYFFIPLRPNVVFLSTMYIDRFILDRHGQVYTKHNYFHTQSPFILRRISYEDVLNSVFLSKY